jgi:hypothetical protein
MWLQGRRSTVTIICRLQVTFILEVVGNVSLFWPAYDDIALKYTTSTE